MSNPFALLDTPVHRDSADIRPGVYYDLSNEEYHSGPGISKSGLDLIAKSPSVFQWSKSAPTHEEKTKALDFGTALHCLLLEPDEFDKRFVVSPAFNRRTEDGRENEKLFLEDCRVNGMLVITGDEREKLFIMRESVMAHPVCRYIFEQEGVNESSIYWNDNQTGELCRVRPDRALKNMPVLVDVKKIDGIDRFKRHVFDFRYHVQAAMYRDGYANQYGGQLPDFWFLVASSSVSAGRYEVDVISLPAEVIQEGEELYRRDLNVYHQCKQANDWLHVRSI